MKGSLVKDFLGYGDLEMLTSQQLREEKKRYVYLIEGKNMQGHFYWPILSSRYSPLPLARALLVSIY